jgi:uncharacterized pyridoxamine 5'-phosphate oxidase family protein
MSDTKKMFELECPVCCKTHKLHLMKKNSKGKFKCINKNCNVEITLIINE